MTIPGYIALDVRTPHFSFESLSTVNRSAASNVATAISINAETDFTLVNSWFDGLLPADALFTVAIGISNPGYGGLAVASPNGGHGTKEIFVAMISDLETTINVFANELSEVFMIVQNRGWNVGGSGKIGSSGEALSRVIGNTLHPLHGVDEGIGPWLFIRERQFHDLRHDYVNMPDPLYDMNAYSWGCGMLFINYLRSQLGFTMRAIISAAADTLAGVYKNLTQDSDAFTKFKGLLNEKFPPDGPPYVNTEDPFPLPSTDVLSTLQYLRKDHPGTKQLRQLVTSKNVGNLRALLNSDRPASLVG